MDIRDQRKRKWLGPLLAILIPGAAHWVAGYKKAGTLLFVTTNALPILAATVMLIPLAAAPACAWALLAAALVLYLLIIGNSYRPQPRVTAKGTLLFLVTFVVLALGRHALFAALPTKTYQIPTNAMAPTLRGAAASSDLSPSRLNGREQVEVIARRSGPVQNIAFQDGELTFDIQGQKHTLPAVLLSNGFRPQPTYEEGDVIWSGVVSSGDHMVVNKRAYLLGEPRRGDIVVFKTNGILHPGVRTDTTYVKRIAGLPGETISIRDGRLVINGDAVDEPAVFQRLHYGNGGQLAGAEDTITLAENEYLVLGDNTAPNMSLDSRFFGAIDRAAIVGKVTAIYWPFDRAGPVE